jgi:hypothetical protein
MIREHICGKILRRSCSPIGEQRREKESESMYSGECSPVLPDFSWHNFPKEGKIYPIATKLTKGHKIYRIA